MAMRWWPPVGLLAALALGLVVGKGPTPVDTWFSKKAHGVVGAHPGWFLVFTDRWLLVPVLAATVAAALLRRQWRLAAVTLICPFTAILITEVLKRMFERQKGGALAYPSGHMTVVVAVMGMLVLVAGGRLLAVTAAVVVSLLSMVGLACTYHYLTDTIGAALVSTAMVCVAARFAGCVAARGGSPRSAPRQDRR